MLLFIIMVCLRGFEPPRDFTPHRLSIYDVYQFQHRHMKQNGGDEGT